MKINKSSGHAVGAALLAILLAGPASAQGFFRNHIPGIAWQRGGLGFWGGVTPGVIITPYTPGGVVSTVGGRSFYWYPDVHQGNQWMPGPTVVSPPAPKEPARLKGKTARVIDPEGNQRRAVRELGDLMRNSSLTEATVRSIDGDLVTVRYRSNGKMVARTLSRRHVFFFNGDRLTSAEEDPALLKKGKEVMIPVEKK